MKLLTEKETGTVVDYMLNLGKQMLSAGASLERAQDAIYRTCRAYGLVDVSLYALSSFLSLSVKNASGFSCHEQTTIPKSSIQMKKLDQLNRLSREVCATKPAPSQLMTMLTKASHVTPYPRWAVCLAQTAALLCLCGLFNGGIRELPAICIIVPLCNLVGWLITKPGADVGKVVYELVSAFLAGSIGMLYCRLVPGADIYILLITSAFMLIPGIPIINSVRNVMCGNEVNGAIELMKVVIETVTIVGGLVVSAAVFGGGVM